MIKALSLRPQLGPHETAHSFLSRFAAMNEISTADFAVDMGLSLKLLVNGEAKDVDRLAKLGGLDLDEQQEMLSWTCQALGNVRMSFRSEVFVTRALRATTIRGCPACLRENSRTTDRKPETTMVMRGDWLLRNVNLCLKHKHPLVQLWSEKSQTNRYDTGSRLSEVAAAIMNGDLDRPLQKPTPYDWWLDNRLENGQDETWLSEHPLYAATAFCELLGCAILRLEKSTRNYTDTEVATARAMGFDVASRGVDAISTSLDDLAASASGFGDEPAKAFGQLFKQLDRAYEHEEIFAPFRDILRDRIFANWPIAPNTEVLGQSIPERRLHSVTTAATEIEIGQELLTQFLVEAGALLENDTRTDAKKTFDARQYRHLLNEVSKLAGPTEMRKAMNATRHEFMSLVEDHVLVPFTNIPTIQSPWRCSDGTALVAELAASAETIDAADDGWERIQRAKARTRIPVGSIIKAIRDGRIRVGQPLKNSGYSGFCVSKLEIDNLVKATRDEKGPKELTIAAFGRRAGMRDQGRIQNLIDAGYITAIKRQNPFTGRMQLHIKSEDITAFHDRFFTLSTVSTAYGVHQRTLLARLKAAGIKPFAPNGLDFGYLYLRQDIEACLGECRIR